MKFGIFDQIDDSGRPLNVQFQERIRLAQIADRVGFDYFHQSEHHATPLSMAPSQSVFLAAVAAQTKLIRLAPLVYLLPIHHPIRLAEEICILDHLSNGRFEFGIGAGASPHEIEALGVPANQAVESYLEAYQIIEQYFASDSVTFLGKHWTVKDMPVSITPLQKPHPALWYVSASPEAAVWPAQNGIQLVCGGPIDKVHLITERYRAEAASAQALKARADALMGVTRLVCVAPTHEKAMDITRKAWPKFHDSFYKLWRKYGTQPRRLTLPPSYEEVIATGNGFAGTPEEVAQAIIDQIRPARLNYFVGHFTFGSMPFEDAADSLELFASKVMPLVRKASQSWL